MIRRGLTLIEVLVCIAIVVVLAAIAVPVFTRAKQAAKQSRSMSNLHQLGVLITLYRDEQGGGAPVGTPDDMALPVGDAFHALWIKEAKNLRAPQRGPCLPFYDYLYYVPGFGGNAWQEWTRYSERVSGQVVLFGDFTFNHKQVIEDQQAPKLGLGVFIDTSVKTRRKAADPSFPHWWHDELP